MLGKHPIGAPAGSSRLAAVITTADLADGCAYRNCQNPADVRIDVLFLTWWSCDDHREDLIELIRAHGIQVTLGRPRGRRPVV
jgi:hypothetical protein